jgi:hypothetical protein
MMVPAKEKLTIFSDGEELPGIIVYGLAAPATLSATLPPDHWDGGQHISTFTLVGEQWEVVLWEIPLSRWPSGPQWQHALSRILETMINQGARVVWVGAEGIPFADPPDLFDPRYMAGAVLTWLTEDGQRGRPFDPDQPLSPATAAELTFLRQFARGLADVD